MDRGTRNTLAATAVVILILFGAYGFIQYSADVNPAFTIVTSRSMQHSDSSEFGVINTGDMMILKNKDGAERDAEGRLITYIEGSKTGYSTFGEYGTVVVYERDLNPDENPIIHRLILWMDLDPDTGTWSAPSLSDYDTGLWSCSADGATWDNLSGTLSLKDVGYSSKNVSIDLDILMNRGSGSGYLTMGDYVGNNNFDQLRLVNSLVDEESIKSVAWIEIPWGGIPKLVINGKISDIDKDVPNAIPGMAMTFTAFILSMFLILYI
jgi:signal peptidase